METTKFTPGPWIAEQPFEVISKEGWGICGVDDNDGGSQEANARLIAAAPDLLEACEAAEKLLARYALNDSTLSDIRAAIAKAIWGE